MTARKLIVVFALTALPSFAFAQSNPAAQDDKAREIQQPEMEAPLPPPQPSYDRPLNNTVTAPPGIGNPGSIPRNSGSIPSR